MSETKRERYFLGFNDQHMGNWDAWMKYIRGGGQGDFPRLGYETIIDEGEDAERRIEALEALVTSLNKALTEAQHGMIRFIKSDVEAKVEALEAETAKLLELAGELAGAELNYRCALSDAGYHGTPDEALELLRQAGEKMRDWSYQQEQLATLGGKP